MSSFAYGKAQVRLVKVVRDAARHELRDITADIQLHGDFGRCYTDGDNTDMPATDSMKNAVYALAGEHLTGAIEEFAATIARELTATGPLVDGATVKLTEHPWARLPAGAGEHDHAFRRDRAGDHVCWVTWDGANTTVEAGIGDLYVLRSTGSGWANFQDDQFRTLKDTDDRILATIFDARWRYAEPVDHQATWEAVRELILQGFADHYSPSVQHTLYLLCERVIEQFPAIESITMTLPNRHHIPFDLTPFGQENTGTVFVVTSEPYGLIEATVTRTV